jgi:hypothetical protein
VDCAVGGRKEGVNGEAIEDLGLRERLPAVFAMSI